MPESTTGPCPYCGRPGTGEPCNPACPPQERGTPAGIRSTDAHDTRQHPLHQAHSPTATRAGALVYCVCGWQGCAQRLEVDAAVWEAELTRRQEGQRPPAGDDRDAAPRA